MDIRPIVEAEGYGKSRVRLVKVVRHPDRHDLKELTVNILLRGDFESCYTDGDNSKVLPTDTMKNTVYVLAKDPCAAIPELFAQLLVRHFLAHNPQVSSAEVAITEHHWSRVDRYTFEQRGPELRTTTVAGDRSATSVVSGIDELVLLKTTKSAFEGYIKDKYTTLPEASDRILATALRATWKYSDLDVPFDTIWHAVRKSIVEAFSEHESKSVQHTLYAVGERVLDTFPQVGEIFLAMPNKHCLLVDLARFGLENKNEIFVPVDEPHGYIEAKLVRGH
jgi:urate oxidase